MGTTPTPRPLLTVEAAYKSYNGRAALAGVDMDVGAGEVHGLLGPNGAGKTTLLSMALGLTRPDAGSLLVNGALVGTPPAAALTAGLLEPAFWPYLSGRANLRALARLDGGVARVRVETELARVGLTGRADTRVGGWSPGMRQRLAIAAALLRRPQLLILDEPTNGLDPESLAMFRSLVRQLAAEGAAVLLSSHAIAEVTALADRVTILAAGRVAFTGSVPDLLARAADPVHRMATTDDAAALSGEPTVDKVGEPTVDKVGEPTVDKVGEPTVTVRPAPQGGLLVTGPPAAVDRYVLALARRGIAVRQLAVATDPLEALFFRLTDPQPR